MKRNEFQKLNKIFGDDATVAASLPLPLLLTLLRPLLFVVALLFLILLRFMYYVEN